MGAVLFLLIALTAAWLACAVCAAPALLSGGAANIGPRPADQLLRDGRAVELISFWLASPSPHTPGS